MRRCRKGKKEPFTKGKYGWKTRDGTGGGVKGWEVSKAVPERDGIEVAGEGTAELEMKAAEGRVSEYKRNWERR
jgi:hypothetical protein